MAEAGTGVRRRSLSRRFEGLLERLEGRAVATGRKRIRVPFYLLRLLLQVVRRWVRDRCPQQASSLAFQTVLSIVPILAVATAALRALGLFAAESRFVAFLSKNLIPASASEVSDKLYAFSKNITFESVGLVGLAVSVILAFVMFNNLERTVNWIWRSEKRRRLTQKFVVFYFAVTVGPALVGFGLVQAASFGLTIGITGALFSVATTFVALFLANYILPTGKVRVRPALVGAVLSTVLFEVAKLGFSAYVSGFALSRYSGIYGALAIVPLWLVWIYYSWMTLLLGIEVTHAVQNLSILENTDRRGEIPLETELMSRVNGRVAARVMVAIVEHYEHGDKALSRRALSDRFDLSVEVVDRIVDRLEESDLLMEAGGDLQGLIPSRPADKILLTEVLRAFRGDDIEDDPSRATRSRVDEVLRDLERLTNERAAQLTLQDLANEATGG